MHIITGLGRSGTTFIAEIFRNLGYEMGSYYNEEVNAGYENSEVAQINKRIMIGDYWGKSHEIEEMRMVAQKYKVVKDPRFIFTLGIWLQAAAEIQSVFLCSRKLSEIVESSERTNAGNLAMFNAYPLSLKLKFARLFEKNFKALLNHYHINWHIIKYPESVKSFNNVKRLELIEPDTSKLKEAWGKARKPLP